MARGHFAKSEAQAASVMKELQGKGNIIESVGTARNYEQALKTCCDYLKEFKLGSLRELTPEQAKNYIELRAHECKQSTIDMDRQAIQTMMQHVTHKLEPNQTLYPPKELPTSKKETIENSRSYTPEQVNAIIQHQTEQHALSTQLCHESGLRAHELLSLRPSGEVNPSPREVHPNKFAHLPNESKTYTVNGKGGLIREVQIPNHLAEKLEERRLDMPQQISDRGVNYESHYNIAGGHKFSDAFSKASSRALGYSNGAHGLRHSYAQNRYEQLANHFERIDVMTIISQELGHFRPDITEVYLR
ncbi:MULTISPECIES: site-specific integrase [Gammaproteobacteria]|uniref:tyrosine-type recombinase/integrase n=1 Tax=Gammaproteobacteria TaxID=1236 RepID=UPI00155E6B62|nr:MULTISPECIES: site-specific integrase [Gammaproteobacteria]MCR1299767.1 site-specific integrase [Enterobacter kobei]MCR1310117.1 site-specific integrase [Enterobacter sp. BT1271]MCR2773322.1 site-specific integrase [Enterobacter kobei]MCR2778077.1 site-specific integrase [Enterobacter kobei]MDA5091633.1 site-specific integrase [Klebsiella quasipneumoniae subsp. quasipneumoniae]